MAGRFTRELVLVYEVLLNPWQTGHSYSLSDLKHLEAAAKEARTRIENWQREKKARPRPCSRLLNSATNTPRDCFTTSTKETSLLGGHNRHKKGVEA
jgi:hypothetical protein